MSQKDTSTRQRKNCRGCHPYRPQVLYLRLYIVLYTCVLRLLAKENLQDFVYLLLSMAMTYTYVSGVVSFYYDVAECFIALYITKNRFFI